ncbi:hypothetical protein [Streptomyces sp. NBC_00280]|uniref:hypothetical protein n=1 Tax=Streptomyces sp. NBC_00280 TaxID=2975699 RepID=UPI002F914F7D
MTRIRVRTLGRPWSTVTVPDGPDEKEQLLGHFASALKSLPELSALPEDLEEFTIIWNGRRVSAYHETVEDEPVFRGEPLGPVSTTL